MRALSAQAGMAKNPVVRTGLLALALVAAWIPRASGQASDFPNKNITLVVPLAPGGANDVLARLVAQKLDRLRDNGISLYGAHSSLDGAQPRTTAIPSGWNPFGSGMVSGNEPFASAVGTARQAKIVSSSTKRRI